MGKGCKQIPLNDKVGECGGDGGRCYGNGSAACGSPVGKLNEPAGPKRDHLTPKEIIWPPLFSVQCFHTHSLEKDLGYHTVYAACGLGMR